MARVMVDHLEVPVLEAILVVVTVQAILQITAVLVSKAPSLAVRTTTAISSRYMLLWHAWSGSCMLILPLLNHATDLLHSLIPVGGILIRAGLKSPWILRIHAVLQSVSQQHASRCS